MDPTEAYRDAVIAHASHLGLDVEKDADLLYVVEDCLNDVLPLEWTQYTDPDNGYPYYFNSVTGESQYDHPLDSNHRELVSAAVSSKYAQRTPHPQSTQSKALSPGTLQRMISSAVKEAIAGSTGSKVPATPSLPTRTSQQSGQQLWSPDTPPLPPKPAKEITRISPGRLLQALGLSSSTSTNAHPHPPRNLQQSPPQEGSDTFKETELQTRQILESDIVASKALVDSLKDELSLANAALADRKLVAIELEKQLENVKRTLACKELEWREEATASQAATEASNLASAALSDCTNGAITLLEETNVRLEGELQASRDGKRGLEAELQSLRISLDQKLHELESTRARELIHAEKSSTSEQRLCALEEELGNARREVEALRAEEAALKSQSKAQIIASQAEHTTLQKTVAGFEVEKEELLARVDSLLKSVAVAESKALTLEDEKTASLGKISALEEEAIRTGVEREGLSASVSALERKLEAAWDELRVKTGAFQEELKVVGSKGEAETTEANSLAQNLQDSLKKTLEALAEGKLREGALQTEIETLRSKEGTYNTGVVNLSQQLEQALKATADEKVRGEAYKTEIEMLRSRDSVNHTEIANLSQQLEQALKVTTDEKVRGEAFKNEVESLKSRESANNTMLSGLSQRLEQALEDINSEKTKNGTLTSSLMDAQNSLSSIEISNREAQVKANALSSELGERLAVTEKKVRDLEAALTEAESRARSAEEALKSTLEALEFSRNETKEERERALSRERDSERTLSTAQGREKTLSSTLLLRIEASEKELRDARVSEADALKRVSISEKALAVAQGRVAALEGAGKVAEMRVDGLEKGLGEAKRELAASENKLVSLKEELSATKEALQKTKDSEAAAVARAVAADREAEALRSVQEMKSNEHPLLTAQTPGGLQPSTSPAHGTINLSSQKELDEVFSLFVQKISAAVASATEPLALQNSSRSTFPLRNSGSIVSNSGSVPGGSPTYLPPDGPLMQQRLEALLANREGYMLPQHNDNSEYQAMEKSAEDDISADSAVILRELGFTVKGDLERKGGGASVSGGSPLGLSSPVPLHVTTPSLSRVKYIASNAPPRMPELPKADFFISKYIQR